MTQRPRDNLLDVPMPADLADSETALLGAVILDPSNLARLADSVAGADFGDPDLGRLYDALQTMHDAGLPIADACVLVPELRRLNVPAAVCDPGFVGRLIVDGGAHAAHATHYAKQVRRAATLRRQHAIGYEWLRRLADPAADPQDLAQWLDAQLQGAGARVADPARPIGDIAREIIDELRQPDAHARGVMTGLPSHDTAAGGWMPGETVILAARPGVGKTSFALQVATHNAMRERPVLFVSLEMQDRELVTRTLCGLSGVDSRRLRSGRLTADDLQALADGAVQVGDVPLRIWAPPAATLARIRAIAKHDAAAGGLALLVVDYIGLVRPADPKRPRYEQVGETSAGLKALAKELGVPVVALCQLNREADGAEPRLSHLRESGAIEQDADIVLFLHRDDADKTAATLIVAKHRHGDTGKIRLRWVPERTRFEDN